MRITKVILITGILSFNFLFAHFASAEQVSISKLWETTNTDLKSPESVLYDSKRDIFYVSSMNGGPLEKVENGFISTFSSDGKIIDKEWFSKPLWAPKGMAIVNDHLFVADISKVVEIDLETAGIVKIYDIKGALFLNDVVAASNGYIYISDTSTNTIHRIKDGKIEAWVTDSRLSSPNGLSVIDDQLVVAAWGVMDGEGFETSVPGHLYNISFCDAQITDRNSAESIGNLDGIEKTAKGSFLVTDWMAGKLKLIDKAGKVEDLLDLGQGSADLDFISSKGLLLIPMMLNNSVRAYHFKE